MGERRDGWCRSLGGLWCPRKKIKDVFADSRGMRRFRHRPDKRSKACQVIAVRLRIFWAIESCEATLLGRPVPEGQLMVVCFFKEGELGDQPFSIL